MSDKLNSLLLKAIEAAPDVIPHLRGRAWWLALGYLERKTVDYYQRVLQQNIRKLYNGSIDEGQFFDFLANTSQRQIRRAWNEGMRLNKLDPRKDMTDELEGQYQDIVTGEFQYIERLARDIVNAAKGGDPISPFLKRAELWANRYTDVVNRALAISKPDQLLRWEWGATEEHCADCGPNNGIVKPAADWLADKDKMPQGHGLDCGGWRCDCRLVNGDTGMLFALDFQNTEMLFAPAERLRE